MLVYALVIKSHLKGGVKAYILQHPVMLWQRDCIVKIQTLDWTKEALF